MIRRLIPLLVFPLAILATGFASAPWLRAFPSATLSVPLFGAALLSVVVGLVLVRLLRPFALTLAIDGLAFIAYSLFVVLRKPFGVDQLVDGLHHGPAQLLSFALPLVSPPSLLITPVALCWLAGAVASETLARKPVSLLPYAGWLIAFGAAYAATERATTTSGSRVLDAALAAGLLVTMAVLRVVQGWIHRSVGAEATQGDGVLPLRPVLAGAATVAVVAVVSGFIVQTTPFEGRPVSPQRVPAVNQATPLTPLSFVSSLRPAPESTVNPELFTVTTSRSSDGYFELANVDYYDGDSWSFTRTFRPSGGVVPAELDASLIGKGDLITQKFQISAGALSTAPWMPYLNRPVTVAGTGINVDSTSGMIVPTATMQDGTSYQVSSRSDARTLEQLPASSLIATGSAPIDTQIPAAIRATMVKVVDSFSIETGQAASSPTKFLQALAVDLHKKYGLASPPGSAAPATAASVASSSTTSTSTQPHAGGTNFSDVIASIVGPQRAGTPEQFATLYALVARQLGVPARVVTGFKVAATGGDDQVLTAGTYTVKASEATTWVEIPVRNVGWVAVNAVPVTYLGTQQQNSIGAASPTANTSSAAPSQNALIDSNNGGHAVAKKSSVPAVATSSHLGQILSVLAALAAMAVLAVLLLLLRKRARRRRRLGESDPRQRLIGAWIESLDVLVESGLHDITHLTGSEIAVATSLRYGPESAAHVTTLARTANYAIFSPRSEISDDVATEAWKTQDQLKKSVRSQLGGLERVSASLRHTSHRASRRADRSSTDGPASWAESAGSSTPAVGSFASASASRGLLRRLFRRPRRH